MAAVTTVNVVGLVGVVDAASTGPPLDGGGDLAAGNAGRGVQELQRGRRSMAAVTGRGRAAQALFARASTGPPLDGGGDDYLDQVDAISSHLLQRGRRSMAAVTGGAEATPT